MFILTLDIFLSKNIVLCQDINQSTNLNLSRHYLYNLSNSEFKTWLRVASETADRINLHSTITSGIYRAEIGKINYNLCTSQLYSLNSINNDLQIISNNVLENARFLIYYQNLYKSEFIRVPMLRDNQGMPTEMYLDTLNIIVKNLRKSALILQSFQDIVTNLDNTVINTITHENLTEINRYQTLIASDLFEFRNHTNNINFNSLIP